MAAMIILPLTAMEKPKKTVIVSNKPSVNTESDIISVMKSESGKVEKTDIKEYTVGALAAEMNLESHDEALKAQAVACYTYALYCKEKANKDDLNGADISDDSKRIKAISTMRQERKNGETSMTATKKRRKGSLMRCSGKG